MAALRLIKKYYPEDSKAYKILVKHGKAVFNKAREIAENNPHLEVDLTFLEEAAMLHDIGIFMTHAPEIGCHGEHPYISHGYLGRELLEKEGFHRHAKVCERHTGVGLSQTEIERQNLPLPKRCMLPKSVEERLVCFADNFFSKSHHDLAEEKSIKTVRKGLEKYGKHQVEAFDKLVLEFLN